MWGCPRDRLQNDILNEQAFSSRYLGHSMLSQTQMNGIDYLIQNLLYGLKEEQVTAIEKQM